VTQAQQNYVIGGHASGTDADLFIWTGDRWQTDGNKTGAAPPGLKGWDYRSGRRWCGTTRDVGRRESFDCKA